MKLTPKENYLMLGRGEMPEYVPFYTMMGTEYMGEAPVKSLSPMVFKPLPQVMLVKELLANAFRPMMLTLSDNFALCPVHRSNAP